MNKIPIFNVFGGRRLVVPWNTSISRAYLRQPYIKSSCVGRIGSLTTIHSPTIRFSSSGTKSTDHHHRQQQQQQLPHDIGGNLSHFDTIETTTGHALQPWEQQCHALFAILATKGYVTTDQLRRSIEDLTPKQYTDWGYYDKWTAAMISLLIDGGLISHHEISGALFGEQCDYSICGNGGSSIDESSILSPPRFQPGDFVQVKSYSDGIEYRRPHIRTPGYVYGVHGRIADVCGQYGDPSLLAFGIIPNVPKVWLYRVEVSMADLWPEQSTSIDTVRIEIYEHWLQPSHTATGREFEAIQLLNHDDSGNDCIDRDTHHHHHHHHHHDSHDHQHHNDRNHQHHDDGEVHDDHPHKPRPQVEVRAVQREGPPRPGKDLFQALLRIVVQKDIVTRDEIRSMVQALDDAGTDLRGATLVVKAWMDPSFKERLLKDPAAVGGEIGISTSNPNAPTVLTVVENTPQVHNLVVCTLCSCYPSSMLGIAPSWYKSSEFRSRAVREPRKVLEDFGTIIPSGKSIRVHDSTADHRYLVLPERPDETEGWSEDELRKLVTRDSMIGVTI